MSDECHAPHPFRPACLGKTSRMREPPHSVTEPLDSVTFGLDSAFEGYADSPQPLGAYSVLASVYTGACVAGIASAHRRGRLPQEIATKDILVLGVATHKIARLITKDAVTSFVRAPFVRLEEKSGSNSLSESPRGHGLRRSVGELISCPECTGQWVASALMIGLVHAPRVTRLIASLYAALAIGDGLQFVYVGIKGRA